MPDCPICEVAQGFNMKGGEVCTYHRQGLRAVGYVPASEVADALRRGVVAGLRAADEHGRAAGVVLGLPSPTEVLRSLGSSPPLSEAEGRASDAG